MPSHLTPSERILRARLAAHKSWANTDDPGARTAPGRAAMRQRFEDQVDPDRVLSESERARRADHEFRSYMAGLSLKSSKVRRARKAGGAA